MDLSFWLTTLSLAALVYAGGTWLYGTYIQPARATRQASQSTPSVKRNRRVTTFKRRSKGSNVHERNERLNEGSEHQGAKEEAVNVQSVQGPPAQSSSATAAPAEDSDNFTLSPRELVQLAEALNLYREGATVEAAVCRAFGVTKGGTEGYRRAKSIFDTATMAPGAAPAGTYQAPAVQRRNTRRTPQKRGAA